MLMSSPIETLHRLIPYNMLSNSCFIYCVAVLTIQGQSHSLTDVLFIFSAEASDGSCFLCVCNRFPYKLPLTCV